MDRNEDNPYAPPQSNLVGAPEIDPILHARLDWNRLESARSGLRRCIVSLLLYVVMIVTVFSSNRDLVSTLAWVPAWLIGLSGLSRIWAAIETVKPLRVLIFIASLYSPLAMLSELIYSAVVANFIRTHGEPLSIFGRRQATTGAA